MIFLVQREIVEDKASSVEDGLAGAKVFHGHDDQVGDLADAGI